MAATDGTDISNSTATATASNYEVCQRTGFRVKTGRLRKEWTGTLVREASHEHRHPLDLLKIKAEITSTALRNPEPTDVFVESAYPSGVSQSNL
jgi:hypothetical protein